MMIISHPHYLKSIEIHWKSNAIRRNSMKFNWDLLKFTEIQWNSTKSNEIQRNPMEFKEIH